MLNLFAGMLNLSVEVPDLIGGLYGEAAGPTGEQLGTNRGFIFFENPLFLLLLPPRQRCCLLGQEGSQPPWPSIGSAYALVTAASARNEYGQRP